MRDKLIEAVARAIADTPCPSDKGQQASLRDLIAAVCEASGLEMGPGFERDMRTCAAAALDAVLDELREPDEAMLDAFEYSKYHAPQDDKREPFTRALQGMLSTLSKDKADG